MVLLEFHSILKKNTIDDERGFKGCFNNHSIKDLYEFFNNCEQYQL
ncbi:hypothetical protein [Clostridium gelidum]|nr:hypothetical protein [Clostridium gelidum]